MTTEEHVITINEFEFKRAVENIKAALHSPNDQAALCLGVASLSTLQDHITANARLNAAHAKSLADEAAGTT